MTIIDLSSHLIGTNGDPNRTEVYAVPNAAMEAVAAVINATWDNAITSKADFNAKIAAAQTTFLNTTTAPHITGGSVTVPTIEEPGVDIPATQSATDVMTMFDTKFAAIVADLVSRFTTFRNTYYPNDATDFAAYEGWVTAALANPNAGLPPAVQAQIWGDDQARIISDKVRAQDAIIAQFANRRFPLPPDAAASAVLQIEQKAQDAMAESSRKVAIMSVDMVKFVVDKAGDLRKNAMDEAIKYITALASAPDIASKLVGVGYDAQSKLISSASQFYNARTQAAETLSKIAQYNTSIALEVSEKNQMSDLALIEDKLKALLAEAQAIAQMTTAMFNNLHAQVSLSSNGGTILSNSATV